MHRPLSAFALAAWASFLVIKAASSATAELSDLVRSVPVADGSKLSRFVGWDAGATVLIAAAAALLLALFLLLGSRRDLRPLGERLALAGFGLIGVLAFVDAGGTLGLGPVTTPFFSVLGLSAFALVFDRMVAVEDDVDDREAFEAGITAIAQAMASQTRLYTDPQKPGR